MRRFPRGPIVLLALVAGIAAGPARAEDEPAGDAVPTRPLLARIADEKDPGRDAALEAWKALATSDRHALALAAMRSRDPGLAFVGALVADPLACDHETLHLRDRAIAKVDPLGEFLPLGTLAGVADGRPSFGSKQLLGIWTALAERDPDDFGYSGTHRSLLPEDVPALVPLLEKAKPRVFRALLEDLSLVASDDDGDEHHDVYVRAFRYGLARLRAEHAKRRPPRMADLPALPAKPGLPAEFVELATAAFLDEKTGFTLAGKPPQESQGRGPRAWLHRWALRLTPAEEDVPFLKELAQRGDGEYPHTPVWSARRIGALGGRAAGHTYALLVQSADGIAVWAAAEKAARGEGADWKRLSDPKGDGWKARSGAVGQARWLADPVEARAAAVEEVRKGEVPGELALRDRWFLEREYGVVISDEDVRGIAAKALETPLDVEVEAKLLAEVLPEPLDAKEAAKTCASWAGRPGEAEADTMPVLSALARLHAVAPQETVALLHAWADGASTERQKVAALVVLARCGDAAKAEAMTKSWTAWKGRRHLLGRVPGHVVEAFLRKEAASTDADAREEAVQALAIHYGCPPRLSVYLGDLSRGTEDFPEADWAEVDALVLAKDPIGAALRRTVGGPMYGPNIDLVGFGTAAASEPRVRERLETWREGGLEYWRATAALATAGDAAARAKWMGFLGEARAFLLDALLEPHLFTLDGDPEMTTFWVSRLDANCCHQWHAHEAISGTFPTFPYEKSTGGGGRTRAGAERWFAKHAGTFVRSPLLDGWIPGPRK